MNKPLLIAHRGDTSEYPENTPEAFISAFEKGADGIELDIQLANDDVIIVHKYEFDRNKSYPKLKNILAKIHDKGRIEIEVKSFNTNIISPLRKIVSNYSRADIEITSSEIPLVIKIKKAFPNFKVGMILADSNFESWMSNKTVLQKLIGWGVMSGADVLHLTYKMISAHGTSRLVDNIHDSGFIVHTHIPKSKNYKTIYNNLKSWNVDQCTFDTIELLELE